MTRRVAGKVFAVYDISSSSVAGGHVLSDGARTTFLSHAREHAPLQEDINMDRFVTETIKHLERVVATVQSEDIHHPSYVQVTLASPWYRSQTRTIVYQAQVPFTTTPAFINKLVDEEIAHMLANEEGPFGVFGTSSLIVEKQLSSIILNGYPTTAPYGKKATTVELSLTITIAPKPVLDRFSEVLKRAYGVRTIGYTTSPFTTFIVMRDRMNAADDCTVIDVGEEVTDVAFIQRGVVLYQHSFPVGTYGLYRALAGKSASTSRESVTMLESYRLGKLSPKASKTIETSLTAFTTHWQSWFQQVVDAYGRRVPSPIVVTVDPRFEILIQGALEADPLLAHMAAHGPLVRMVTSDTFSGQIGDTEGKPIDVPLATTALFVEQFI